MKYKRGYFLLLISVLLLGGAGAVPGIWGSRIHSTNRAETYDELILEVKTQSGVYDVCIWKEAENSYCFFLPSAVSASKVCFSNIADDMQLTLNEKTVKRGEALQELIPFGERCTLQMTAGETALEAAEVVFYRSENLPAMFLELEEEDFEGILGDKEWKVDAAVKLIDESGEKEYADKLDYVRTRGNSTFYGTDKKSFQIKLKRSASMLGMEEADKWILMAQAFDAAFMRNELVQSFAKENTDVLAEEGEYTDLYINGEYYGLFYLCEKVEVGENRVNIRDMESLNKKLNGEVLSEAENPYVAVNDKICAAAITKNPEDITGGYLVELVPGDVLNQQQCAFRTESGKGYRLISPQNATREQVEYICNLFNEMEAAFAAEDGICPSTGKHYSEYLDVDSWVKKYVLEEVFHDPDGSVASAFFYKDSDEVDTRIHAGPLWDYDRTLGAYAIENTYWLDIPEQVLYSSAYADLWMQRMEIREQVAETFQEVFTDRNVAKLLADTYEIEDKIVASAQMNNVRWKQSLQYYESLKANREYLSSFLQRKIEYLTDVWLENEEYHTVTFLDYDGGVCAQYYVKHGGFLTEKPDVSSYVAMFAGWYSKETGHKLEMQLPVLENVTYQSAWIDMGLLIQNDLAIYELDVQEIDVEELQALVDGIRKMQEEQEE